MWQPLETAPKDGTRIDIWAKAWLSTFDKFTYQRFTNCYWWNGDGLNHKGKWMNLHDNWYPTHWMPIPDGPGGAVAGKIDLGPR